MYAQKRLDRVGMCLLVGGVLGQLLDFFTIEEEQLRNAGRNELSDKVLPVLSFNFFQGLPISLNRQYFGCLVSVSPFPRTRNLVRCQTEGMAVLKFNQNGCETRLDESVRVRVNFRGEEIKVLFFADCPPQGARPVQTQSNRFQNSALAGAILSAKQNDGSVVSGR